MKRKIALLLAVVMILSLVPMMSFAASDNTVNRIASVSSTADLEGSSPLLRIKNKDNSFRASTTETFRLILSEGAEWNDGIVTDAWVAPATGANEASSLITVSANTGVQITTSRITKQILEVSMRRTAGSYESDFTIFVPMNVELKSASGELQVTVDRRDSTVTGGTYTFASASGGATVTTFGSKVSMTRGTVTGASIVIDETIAGSFEAGKTNTVRLRLPDGFRWLSEMAGTNPANIRVNGFTGTTTVTATVVSSNTRDLEVTFVTDTETRDNRGSITIIPRFEATRDAKHGDVNVNLTNRAGAFSNASGVIANYKAFDVTVELKDGEVKEFLAGYEEDTYETAEIIIKEEVAGSILTSAGQYIDFELPNWVKIATGQDISITQKGTSATVNPTIYGERSKFEVRTADLFATSGTKELKFKIPVSIAGTRTGDFALTIKGAGLEEQELVVGKAVAPVTAEVKVADVRIGLQNQKAPEIIIKETFPGAIRKGNIDLTFHDAIGFRFDNAKVEVLDGDIKVDVDDSGREDASTLRVIVDAESDREEAVIRIYDIEMTVNRTAPEGLVRLNIGGDAIVDNNGLGYKDFPSRVARFDFANVITPAPGEVNKEEVSLTIGVVPEGADAAPYVKNNRTYAPVSAVAQSLGVAKSNIIWNAEARTVTILGEKTVQMTIGSTTLLVNGTPVVMDVAPEITSSRTFLPIAWLAKALDVEYSWDAATQTVTFY